LGIRRDAFYGLELFDSRGANGLYSPDIIMD